MSMSMSVYDQVRENLPQVIEQFQGLVPEGLSMKFRRKQGEAAGPEGREFSVSGPKADKVRALIFADLGLTRKQISDLVDCSVSRVAEVVWGLDYDKVEYPTIPLRETKPEPAPKPGLTPQDDNPANGSTLMEQLEASIEQVGGEVPQDNG